MLILIVEFWISLGLQNLGDYEIMFKWSKKLRFPIVHSTFLSDWFSLKFQNELSESDPQLQDLIENANQASLRQHDPITGDTALHVAFQKCFFKEIEEMVDRGGNLNQKNNAGDCLISLLELAKIENIRQLKETNGADIFFQKRISRDGKEFRCKINVFKCDDEAQFEGKITFIDDQGKEQSKGKLSCPLQVVLAICLMKEVGKGIENNFQNTQCEENSSLVSPRSLFQNLTNFFLNQAHVDALANLIEFCSRKQKDKKQNEESINWCCTNTLHKNAKIGNRRTFNVWTLFGATLDAKNSNEETPFQTLIKTLNIPKISDEIELKPLNEQQVVQLDEDKSKFLWHALIHGAASFASTDEEKSIILDLVNTKCFLGGKKLPANLKSIYFHAVAQDSLENVEHFLKLGYDANDSDELTRTVLHHAAKCGSIQSMKVLIENKANVDSRDIYNQAPIHFAAKHGKLDCLQFLIKSKHKKSKTQKINVKGQFGLTPLHLAVKNNHSNCVEFLLNNKANVKATGQFKQTPTHIAAWNGTVEILKLLIVARADVNATDSKGQTPLHQAAIKGSLECVKHLLENGAKTSAVDKNGKKAVDLCTDEQCKQVLAAH
jgi:ankyrin repeat protein